MNNVRHHLASDGRQSDCCGHQRDQGHARFAGGEVQHDFEIERHENRHTDKRTHITSACESRAAHNRIT